MAARAFSSTSGAWPTTDTVINFATVSYDTHSVITTGAGWNYRIPVSGYYKVSASHEATSSGATTLILRIRKNGSQFATGTFPMNAATSNIIVRVDGQNFFNAGDTIDIAASSSAGTGTFVGSASASVVQIERLSGPATIAASETVAMARSASVVRSVPTAGAYLDFDFTTGFTDTHGAWRAGSGYVAVTGAWSVQPAYVVPVSGIYSVSVRILLGSTAGFKQLYMNKNGSPFASTADDNTFAGNFTLSMHGQIRCNAGDLLQVFFAPQNAQNAPSTVTNFWTGIEISRVGN